MPNRISDDQYGQAVLQSVQKGAYPDPEELISAELPSSALPKIVKLLDNAREDIKATIREISQDSAPDVDGWISQAKQLRDDIKDSEEQACIIVSQDKHGEGLQEQANDAASKLRLLHGEVAFNESLATTMERIREVRRTMSSIQEAVLGQKLLEAMDMLSQGEGKLESLQGYQNTRVAALLRAKIEVHRKDLEENVTESWNSLVQVHAANFTITINEELQNAPHIDITIVAEALLKLGLLQNCTLSFCNDLDKIIFTPRLCGRMGGNLSKLRVDGNRILLSGQSADGNFKALFSELDSAIAFLRARLPPSIVAPLSGLLMPGLVAKLISAQLSSAVPVDLNGMHNFQGVIDLVLRFAESLESYQWPGKGDLVAWTNGISRIWLDRRRDTSLDKIRKLLRSGLGETKIVERIETQVLSRDDRVFASGGGGDDWDAEWSDDEINGLPNRVANHESESAEEEDVSAWGLDDGANDDVQKSAHRTNTNEDDADAWGWGDEAELKDSTQVSQLAVLTKTKERKINGHPDASSHVEREVTLRETYNITALPEEILKIITQIVFDAEALSQTNYASSPLASAATGLSLIPGLALAMYRASAPNYYSINPSGSMFLYNDSLWMAEQLRQFSESHIERARNNKIHIAGKLKLGADISALENFGKSAYGKEMESQRTILGDLLDGAQGFVNCTEHPFAQECDLAIISTVDRLRDVEKQWKAVLSHSALLQSLGSLLSTVVNKILVDVGDMSDISEPESQRLTAFCNRIAALEDLFTPQQPSDIASDGEQAMPLTAVYAQHWLKFQYLSQILDSSLADIKYLWTEGELRLEFSVDELTDLIQALFADSEHRRRAIAEIRRA